MKHIYNLNFLRNCFYCILFSLTLVQCQSTRELANTNQPNVGATAFESWNAYQNDVSQYPSWHLKAKVGFTFPSPKNKQERAEEKRGESKEVKRKAVSGTLDWQQKNNDFNIQLSGPLGMGRVSIEKQGNETVLTNNKGRQYTSTSLDKLFYQHTGVYIPWSNFSWWLRALPAPSKAFEYEMGESDFLVSQIKQSGWTIDYVAYKPFSNAILPSKIKLSNGKINATFIIRDWNLMLNE